MCLVGWLHFLTLEKWPFVEDILCIPEVYSPLVTSTICSRCAPNLCGLCGSFYYRELVIVGCLVGLADPWSGWLPGSALCGGCQPLFGRARSCGWLQKPGGLWG